MLDNFIYEDHLGRRFVGLENGVYLNYSDLRDYEWSYDTVNNRISRFYRPIIARKIPLVMYCSSDEDAVAVKNRLLELADTDVVARLPGKVYIGDFFTNGYITASKKSEYLINKRMCKIELTLTSDDPAWYREQTHVFVANPTGDPTRSVMGGTDYPYDYKYDYGISLVGRNIILDTADGSPFRLRIYGHVTDPSINIGGHTYAVNGTISTGESLLIDSVNKTITLTTATGGRVSWFDKRGRKDYIFEPLPPGQNPVRWVGTFGFDLTTIEKRSEPKWT